MISAQQEQVINQANKLTLSTFFVNAYFHIDSTRFLPFDLVSMSFEYFTFFCLIIGIIIFHLYLLNPI